MEINYEENLLIEEISAITFSLAIHSRTSLH